MFSLRPTFIALLLSAVALSPTLSSCGEKEETVAPARTGSQQLTTGSWRLDEIRQGGQVSSSGTGIKDRYTLTFRADGTYSQKMLADNTVFNGTNWQLMGTTMLHLTDHKGTEAVYTVVSLTDKDLRYRFTNKDNQTEERIFAAQP